MPANLQGLTLEQQILCTCLGASITSLCTTPLDVVKVRLQAEQKQMKKSLFTSKHRTAMSLCNCKALFSNVPTRFVYTCTNTCFRGNTRFFLKNESSNINIFKASMDVCKNIARTEGIGTLWSGLGPALVMSVPGTMIYYTAYDHLKAYLGYNNPDPYKLHIPVLAGTLSRVLAVTVVSPIELLRTKMQSARLTYAQTFACVSASVRSHGPAVLFRGLSPSLLRDVPFSAIYWLSYEAIKSQYAHIHPQHTPPPSVIFLAGALSGTLAALLTCPFDVVKTHMQIDLGEDASKVFKSSNTTTPFNINSNNKPFNNNSNKPIKAYNSSHSTKPLGASTTRTSTLALLRALYATKGGKALFAGIVPRLVKVAPACAVMITSYEMGKNYFRNKNGASD